MKIRRPVPNTDMVFSSSDLYVGELFAHAQSCIWLLGYSDMATLLLSNKDPHADGAALLMGLTYDEFMRQLKELKNPIAKGFRQGYKPISFGKPASMGDVKIVLTNRRSGQDTPCPNGPVWIIDGNRRVRGYKGTRFCILVDGAERCGVEMVNMWGRRGHEERIPPTCAHCLQVSRRMSDVWRNKAREHRTYGNLIQEFIDTGMVVMPEALDRWPHLKPFFAPYTQLDPGQIMQHVSGRIRGGLGYMDCSNTFFQALVGDLTKAALWRVSMECYDRTMRIPSQLFPNSKPSRYAGGPSPLYGSRVIGFFHDELFGEHPRSVASDCALRIEEVMESFEAHYMPDLAPACRAEACLMEGAWDKRAEPQWKIGGNKRKGPDDILVPWTPPTPKEVVTA